MPSLNKVMLIGNLTRDPEVRYTPSNTAVCDLGVAVNRRWRGADGQDHEETCFARVTVWSRDAENCGKYLRKGAPVFIEGRLKTDEWEKDGQKQSRLGVVAERVQFLGPRGQEAGDAEDARPRSSPARGGTPARETGAPRETAPAADAGDAAPAGGDEENLPF